MIAPGHSRLVGVEEVDKDLDDEEEIKGLSKDKRIYFSSDYLVLYNKKTGRAAIVQVEREGMPPLAEGKGVLPTSKDFTFMREVKGVKVLSKAKETVVVKRGINVMNRSQLIAEASKIAKGGIRAVVFLGGYDHVNFVIDPPGEVPKIEVVDVVPPRPSRLMESLKLIRESELRDVPIELVSNEIDLLKIAGEMAEEHSPTLMVFPCSASDMPGEIKKARVAFLDKKLEVENEKVALIGCEISKSVFEEVFPGKEFNFYNICPRNLKISGSFIMRCCLRDKLGPLEIEGHRGYVIHWGATYEEIVEGIKHVIEGIK
jgi:hypothetical protein